MAIQDIHSLKRSNIGVENAEMIVRANKTNDLGVRPDQPQYMCKIYTDFDACADEWREFQKTALCTPFQSLDWLQCWWQAYQSVEPDHCLELNLVFVYARNELALILPLIVEPYKGVRRLLWLCGHLSDYNAPIIHESFMGSLDPESIDLLWADIFTQIDDVDLLFLPKQPHEIAGQPNPFYGYRASDYMLQYHSARILGDWQTYYTTRRKGKSRSRLKAKGKYLRVNASMTIEEISDPDERSKIVLQTINWKRTQVNATGAIDPFADCETELFFDNISRHSGLSGDFRVFSLNADGLPIACAFGLNSGKSFIMYQTAYAVGAHAKYSPGVLLLTHMMEVMADEGRDVFDFSIGDEPYKFEWADCHEGLTISLKSNSLKGWLAQSFILAKLNLKGWIKSSDARFEMAKSINRFVKKLMPG